MCGACSGYGGSNNPPPSPALTPSHLISVGPARNRPGSPEVHHGRHRWQVSVQRSPGHNEGGGRNTQGAFSHRVWGFWGVFACFPSA